MRVPGVVKNNAAMFAAYFGIGKCELCMPCVSYLLSAFVQVRRWSRMMRMMVVRSEPYLVRAACMFLPTAHADT